MDIHHYHNMKIQIVFFRIIVMSPFRRLVGGLLRRTAVRLYVRYTKKTVAPHLILENGACLS